MSLKVLLVSDHESAYIWDHFDRRAFEGVELVVSCGDLKPEYLSFLVTMLPVPLLYVHGNHDGNYAVRPPEGCVDLEEKMAVVKGVRFLGFGGCKSPQNRPHHVTERQMEKNVRKSLLDVRAHGGFDVLVTHAAAAGLGDGSDSFHEGFPVFNRLIGAFHPAYHLHGHQHMNYAPDVPRMSRAGDTTIVNGYEYVILDLDIPARGRSKPKIVWSELLLPGARKRPEAAAKEAKDNDLTDGIRGAIRKGGSART